MNIWEVSLRNTIFPGCTYRLTNGQSKLTLEKEKLQHLDLHAWHAIMSVVVWRFWYTAGFVFPSPSAQGMSMHSIMHFGARGVIIFSFAAAAAWTCRFLYRHRSGSSSLPEGD